MKMLGKRSARQKNQCDLPLIEIQSRSTENNESRSNSPSRVIVERLKSTGDRVVVQDLHKVPIR